MPDLSDELETEEVGKDLWDVVDDRGDAEESWRAPQILQVPEEESEDQAYAESHKPGYVEEGAVPKIGESAKDRQPFW